MTANLSQRGRKGLMAIVVAALFMLNLNVALAADSASISGYVWYDDNGDGVFDQGEGGLEGVTVYLYRDNDGGLVGTQTSAQDGSYRFGDLSAGDYIVQVPETVKLGLAEYAPTTDNPLPISLAGEDCSDVNFGYEGVASPAGPAPTAVTLSSFVASSASQSASFHWARLAVLATLAVGGIFWIRQQL